MGHFLPFLPPDNPENQILKLKKIPGDIIILHICSINDKKCMVPEIWSVTENFLLFWTVFCPFTPLWTQKIKILKKWKKNLKILSFYKCVPEMTVIWCMVPEIWSAMGRIFVILDCFLPFQSCNNPTNQNFEKIKKLPAGDIIILNRCTTNENHMMHGCWDTEWDRQNFLSF